MGWGIRVYSYLNPTREESNMAHPRRFLLVLVLLLSICVGIAAQSNDTIDTILGEETATVGSVAYVALSAGDLISDETSFRDAVQQAVTAGWLADTAGASDPAGFGQLAHLLMQIFEVRGGIMYRLFPGPRYATREFTYQGWSPVRIGPGDAISGDFLLSVTGIFLEDLAATQEAGR
jgi:hypothetical protein